MTARQKSSDTRKRLLLVDDHPMLREGLAQLVNQEPDLAVCGEAESAAQALDAVLSLKPDLLLLDISLPDRSGLELIKDLRALQPQLPVLVISMHDETLYAERVLRAGGRGYIMKQAGGKKLMAAIRQVLGGQVYVSEKISAQILSALGGRGAKAETPMDLLTDRELEVLQLLGLGKGTSEIAAQLHLSVKTVEAHRANIKRRLNLRTGPELVRYAVRWVETRDAG